MLDPPVEERIVDCSRPRFQLAIQRVHVQFRMLDFEDAQLLVRTPIDLIEEKVISAIARTFAAAVSISSSSIATSVRFSSLRSDC